MTPAKRRKILRNSLLLCTILVAGLMGRFLFLGQSIPSLLMGRKPGASAPGTGLVKAAQANTNSSSTDTPIAMGNPNISTPSSNSKYKTVQFDLLTTWTYDEKNPLIPENVKALDGKEIEISGFMLPINQTENITSFILVNSLWGCCFGNNPAVNHVIVVNMEEGKAVDFYPDPVTVSGRFSVGETREEGYLVSVFQMEGKKVVVR